MKNKLIILFLIILYATIVFNRCERKLTGLGDDAEIRVLADSSLWLETEPLLRDIFEVPIITPQNETIFSILKGDLENFKRFKNLILIATLDSDGIVSNVVKSNLSVAALEKVKEGNYVFIKKEQWATNQLIMFLVSTSLDSLKNKLEKNKDYLFSIYDDYWNDVQEKQMYSFDQQKDVEKHLLKEYGWKINVQYDYEIYIEKPEQNFIMLRRMLPERWLFVNWIDTDDPSVINEEWVINKRDELGEKFYEGDMVETKFVKPEFEDVDFNNRLALKTTGIWRNDEKQAGGPFISYTFYNSKQGRIYMVDYAIFSPRLKRMKRTFLRQADIMLNTFKTVNEVKE